MFYAKKILVQTPAVPRVMPPYQVASLVLTSVEMLQRKWNDPLPLPNISTNAATGTITIPGVATTTRSRSASQVKSFDCKSWQLMHNGGSLTNPMASYITYDIDVAEASTMYLTVNFTTWHTNEDLALTVINDNNNNIDMKTDMQTDKNTPPSQAHSLSAPAQCQSQFFIHDYTYKNGQHDHAGASSPADCCSKCAAYTGFKCTAWTYAPPSCWFKTNTGGGRNEGPGSNITSGSVAAPTPVPPTPPTPPPPTPPPLPPRQTVPVFYAHGFWKQTLPIPVQLAKGKNTLEFTRMSGTSLAIKTFTLTKTAPPIPHPPGNYTPAPTPAVPTESNFIQLSAGLTCKSQGIAELSLRDCALAAAYFKYTDTGMRARAYFRGCFAVVQGSYKGNVNYNTNTSAVADPTGETAALCLRQ
jgi:hypothetical protein